MADTSGGDSRRWGEWGSKVFLRLFLRREPPSPFTAAFERLGRPRILGSSSGGSIRRPSVVLCQPLEIENLPAMPGT